MSNFGLVTCCCSSLSPLEGSIYKDLNVSSWESVNLNRSLQLLTSTIGGLWNIFQYHVNTFRGNFQNKTRNKFYGFFLLLLTNTIETTNCIKCTQTITPLMLHKKPGQLYIFYYIYFNKILNQFKHESIRKYPHLYLFHLMYPINNNNNRYSNNTTQSV